MRTANPALNAKTFERFEVYEPVSTMTLGGTAFKTGVLLLLLSTAAIFSWNQFLTIGKAAMPWVLAGAIGGFVIAMITVFKKEWAPVTSPLYAIVEGFVLGTISAVFEAVYPGIVFQAITLTMGTLFCLLLAYGTGMIRATENFKLGVVAATGGIALIYLATMVMGFFGSTIPYIHESGWIGIGFSIFVVIIAALNLVLDFDFIEQGVERGAPKYMEWYGAFGLIVTLVWLYLEILRLLAKLQSRD